MTAKLADDCATVTVTFAVPPELRWLASMGKPVSLPVGDNRYISARVDLATGESETWAHDAAPSNVPGAK